MRASLPADALDALCARCRTTPTLEALRDLVDRPDPAVQTLLAEPWALPWLERLFDADPVLAATEAARAGAEGADEALFFAQSLLYALSHHPTTSAAPRVARVLAGHPVEAVRLAACRAVERWGQDAHEPWLRAVFGDANTNVRRRALRAVMARDVPTAWDRIDAATAAATGDVLRLRDLLHVVGRDADRRFAFERKGFRDHDARWLTLARSYARSRDRELRADAEYALLGAPR